MIKPSRRPLTGNLSDKEIERMKFGMPVTIGENLIQAWAALETASQEGSGKRWENAVIFARRRIEAAEVLAMAEQDAARRSLAEQEIANAREELRAA